MNVSRHALASLSPLIPAKAGRVPAFAGTSGVHARCSLISSGTTRKRILLTRVTRIFQLLVFTKFALAARYRHLRGVGGTKTSASGSCGRGPRSKHWQGGASLPLALFFSLILTGTRARTAPCLLWL